MNLTVSPLTLSYKAASLPSTPPKVGVSTMVQSIMVLAMGSASYIIRPGVSNLNVSSGNSELSLNNYFGWHFNGTNGSRVDPVNGDIRFTDNDAA